MFLFGDKSFILKDLPSVFSKQRVSSFQDAVIPECSDCVCAAEMMSKLFFLFFYGALICVLLFSQRRGQREWDLRIAQQSAVLETRPAAPQTVRAHGRISSTLLIQLKQLQWYNRAAAAFPVTFLWNCIVIRVSWTAGKSPPSWRLQSFHLWAQQHRFHIMDCVCKWTCHRSASHIICSNTPNDETDNLFTSQISNVSTPPRPFGLVLLWRHSPSPRGQGNIWGLDLLVSPETRHSEQSVPVFAILNIQVSL